MGFDTYSLRGLEALIRARAVREIRSLRLQVLAKASPVRVATFFAAVGASLES